jgi:hypothetical protein
MFRKRKTSVELAVPVGRALRSRSTPQQIATLAGRVDILSRILEGNMDAADAVNDFHF